MFIRRAFHQSSWFQPLPLPQLSNYLVLTILETFLGFAVLTVFFVYGTLLWKSLGLSFPYSSNCLLPSKNLLESFILSPPLFSLLLWVYIIISLFLSLYWNFSREWQYVSLPHLSFLNLYLFLREREIASGGGWAERRGRCRIWSKLQALSCQHRTWRRAQMHEPQDHDLSRSQMLNQLSHPAPLHYPF